MATLPQEIIENILSRLPVKPLLRFRCVSKTWCAKIDSQDFINLHLSHSISTASNLSLIARRGGTLYSLDNDSLETLPNPEIPFYNPKRTNLFSTCNGLLLLQNYNHNEHRKSEGLFLFNPSTRKSILLPPPPPSENLPPPPPTAESLYVGYDIMTDDYKVFNVLAFFESGSKPFTCELRVFSLKSNSWHIISDYYEIIIHMLNAAYVNGALHSVHREEPTSVLALDIEKESLNKIPMPNFMDTNVSLVTPYVFDGCLAISCLYSDYHTDIWVMGEYGVKESWSLLLSVKPEKRYYIHVVPIVYSKTRNEVLLSYVTYACHKVVWYDLKKNSVRDFQLHGSPIVNPVVCVGSLVSVASPRETDEKKAQQEVEKMKGEIVEKKRLD